jgi:hypothetical protein
VSTRNASNILWVVVITNEIANSAQKLVICLQNKCKDTDPFPTGDPSKPVSVSVTPLPLLGRGAAETAMARKAIERMFLESILIK